MSKLYEGFDESAPAVVIARFRTRKEAQAWVSELTWAHRRRWQSLTPAIRQLLEQVKVLHPAFRIVPRGCKHPDCQASLEYQRFDKVAKSNPRGHK